MATIRPPTVSERTRKKKRRHASEYKRASGGEYHQFASPPAARRPPQTVAAHDDAHSTHHKHAAAAFGRSNRSRPRSQHRRNRPAADRRELGGGDAREPTDNRRLFSVSRRSSCPTLSFRSPTPTSRLHTSKLPAAQMSRSDGARC